MNAGNPPSVSGGLHAVRIEPRRGKLRPLTMALQLALFRVDKGDTVPRVVKLGELIVRKALAGDNEMIKLAFERMDGKAMPVDEDGNEIDLHGSTVRQLVELLIERKRSSVVDVVAEMVDTKTKE